MAKSLCGKWPIVLLLLTAIVGKGIAGQQHVPNLLKISRPIRSPFDKHEAGIDYGTDAYVWESAKRVILVRERYSISRYNLTAHAKRRLSSAPESLMQEARPAKHDIGELEVSRSPDGKWLQWKPRWGCTYLLSLVGAKHLPLATEADIAQQHFVWFADSKHYAVFNVAGCIVPDSPIDAFSEVCLADIRHPGKEQHLPITPADLFAATDVLASLGLENRILFVTSNSYKVKSNSDITLTLYSCSFGKSANMQKQATIPISKGARIACAAISSDGKRLAWVEEMPNKTASLWVGRIDGTGKREIGAVSGRTPEWTTYVTDLQWLPDNQHLSFVSAETLYTVDSK